MTDYIADDYAAIAQRLAQLQERREASPYVQTLMAARDLIATLSGEELDKQGLELGMRRRGRSDAEFREYMTLVLTMLRKL